MQKINQISLLFSRHKSISISRFISLSLYETERGYYHKKRIGEDFITSPQISQMFGECIAVFFSMIQKNISITKNFFELGPGNGVLLNDFIRSIYKIKKEKINYFFLEKSNFINKNFFKKLKEKAEIVKLKKLYLEKKPYYFICNEFFDALPINQFEKKKNAIYEKRIIIKNNQFEIIKKKTDLLSKKYLNLKDGDIIEVSPLSDLYLKKIFKHIQKFGGGMIIFDYGPFYKKKVDTLQAIYKRKKSNFLRNIYETDITYHIDFQEIKKKSSKFSLKAYGPISQKKFLFFNGINERFMSLSKKCISNFETKTLESHYKRLTDPYGMGGLIKCIYISKDSLDLDYFNE